MNRAKSLVGKAGSASFPVWMVSLTRAALGTNVIKIVPNGDSSQLLRADPVQGRRVIPGRVDSLGRIVWRLRRDPLASSSNPGGLDWDQLHDEMFRRIPESKKSSDRKVRKLEFRLEF